MFPVGSPPRRVLITLSTLAIDQGYTGYGAGPTAAKHWDYVQTRTDLTQEEICFTLTGLEAHGLVKAPPKTADSGAHLGQAWISSNGVAVVQTWSVPPDPVPITIASISQDSIASLHQLVAVSRALGVSEADIQALAEAIDDLANTDDASDRLAKTADLATVLQGSEGLTRTLITVVLPTIGRWLG